MGLLPDLGQFLDQGKSGLRAAFFAIFLKASTQRSYECRFGLHPGHRGNGKGTLKVLENPSSETLWSLWPTRCRITVASGVSKRLPASSMSLRFIDSWTLTSQIRRLRGCGTSPNRSRYNPSGKGARMRSSDPSTNRTTQKSGVAGRLGRT